jgi:hypothetical protein
MMCTKQYTPVCTKNVTATSTTCDGMLSTWNLTVTAFVELNDNVNDACNIDVGGIVRFCVLGAKYFVAF